MNHNPGPIRRMSAPAAAKKLSLLLIVLAIQILPALGQNGVADPVEKVAIIGHSFTMDLHWSSPSAFVPIVTVMFARENSSVQFRQFQAGGLNPHVHLRISIKMLWPGSPRSCFSLWRIGAMKTAMIFARWGRDSGPPEHES
jgi:hypothetical protein